MTKDTCYFYMTDDLVIHKGGSGVKFCTFTMSYDGETFRHVFMWDSRGMFTVLNHGPVNNLIRKYHWLE